MLHSTLGSQLSSYRPTAGNAARDAWDFLTRPLPTRPDVMEGRRDPASTARAAEKDTAALLEEYKDAAYREANPYRRLFNSVKNWNWSKHGNSHLGRMNSFYERVYDNYIERVKESAEKLVAESIDMLPDGDPLKQALQGEAGRDVKLRIKYIFLPDDTIVEAPVGMLLVDHEAHHRKWTFSLNDATLERVPDDYDDLDTKHAMHAHFVAKPFEGTKVDGIPIAPEALIVCSEPNRGAKAGRGPLIAAADLGREIGAYIAAEYRKEMESNRAATTREREIAKKAKARNDAYVEGGYPFVKTLDAALKHSPNSVRKNVFAEAVTIAKIGTGVAVGATENPIEAVHFGLRYMY